MEKAGVNPDRFSGISMRKGGLATAIEAGIHEAVPFVQRGQSKTA